MPYSATTYLLLISAPSDVPLQDIGAVESAVSRWNALYGRKFGAVVVAVHWRGHAAAEHGRRPQDSLNEQLVAMADIVLALFWHRLGSPTGEAESGTVEEIEEAQRNGAYVAILECVRGFPQEVDTEQLQRLRDFYASVKDGSLMLAYADEAELSRHVDAILTRAVTRDDTRAEVEASSPEPNTADVWPRIERGVASSGRTQWRVVLANTGTAPARDVRFRLEAEKEGDHLPSLLDDERPLEALAPGGEASYIVMIAAGVAPQARCVVIWNDPTGEHENQATLRFF